MVEFPVLDRSAMTALRVIEAEVAANPAWLDSPECPYPDEIRLIFQRLFVLKEGKTPEKPTFLGRNGTKWAALEAESAELYENLKKFGQELKPGDVAEQMSYYRTATSLLEKIITINERAVGLKHIHEFQERVLETIDSSLTVDQRTSIMQKLRDYIDMGEDPDAKEKA